jgi:prephenate dehydratase
MKIPVAIQGIKGSYSEDAARRFFGAKAEIVEYLSFEDTFHSVVSRQTKYAVVPLKNKIVGEIKSATELLNRTNLKISDELLLKVRHVLCGTGEAEFENLKTVRSHIEALKQCGKFLSGNNQLRQIIGADTASGIRRIVEENAAENAAIGSRRAAEIYGAKIIKENIADDSDNWTTFYLLEN